MSEQDMTIGSFSRATGISTRALRPLAEIGELLDADGNALRDLLLYHQHRLASALERVGDLDRAHLRDGAGGRAVGRAGRSRRRRAAP
ncbi:MAG: hypothetical protein R6W48_03750, partial [Gaiellaceae bacterium]